LSATYASKTASLAVALCCSGMCAVTAESGLPLELKQTIALRGVEGRIDHLTYDPVSERLFVCALGNNTVEVIDLRRGERIHSITGLGSPQGILYTRDLDRLFVVMIKAGF
jgi:DNA-binding beta-propeller fold protein YncE